MYRCFSVFLLVVIGQVHAGYPVAKNFKEDIQREQLIISQLPPEQYSEHEKALAILYVKDQNLEKAFEMFLKALADTQPESTPKISEQEQALYTQALKLYLDNPNGSSPHEISLKLLQDYSPILKKNPNYHLLGFLIAAAYANIEEFPQYFQTFFESYKYYPSHYLAFKGKAALHAQLFARSKTPAEHEVHAQQIIQNLILAIEQYPYDTSLYKMLFMFAPENDQKKLIDAYMNKIIDENIIIPRSDIAFFVQQAVMIKQLSLAKRFLNKCQEWYPNSRSVQASQKYIILETAVQGDKVMQGFKSESFVMVGDHSQSVKAPTITNNYGLKDCVNLSPSNAVSRIITE